MDKHTEHVLNQISASIPKHLMNSLMKKEVNEDMDKINEALTSNSVSKENKAKLRRIKLGMLKDEAHVVDEKIAKEIDLYLATKVQQAIKKGIIPKADKDEFVQEMQRKTAK